MLQQSNNQANINLVTFYAKFIWFGRYLYYMSFPIQPPKRLMHVCNFPVWCFPCQQTWLGRSTVGELWGFVGWTNLYLGPELVYPHRVDSSFMLWDSTDKPTVCCPQKTLPGTQNGKTANRPRWVFIGLPTRKLRMHPIEDHVGSVHICPDHRALNFTHCGPA